MARKQEMADCCTTLFHETTEIVARNVAEVELLCIFATLGAISLVAISGVNTRCFSDIFGKSL